MNHTVLYCLVPGKPDRAACRIIGTGPLRAVPHKPTPHEPILDDPGHAGDGRDSGWDRAVAQHHVVILVVEDVTVPHVAL